MQRLIVLATLAAITVMLALPTSAPATGIISSLSIDPSSVQGLVRR